MGACKSFSENYLNLLNGLMGVCALVIIGYSSFLASELGDFRDVISNGAVATPIAFGVFLLLVSMLGCCAVSRQSKILMLLYILASSFITVTVLGSGIALLVFSGVLDDFENGRIDVAQDEVAATFVDFQLAIFNKCCAEPFDGANAALPCSDDAALEKGCISDNDAFGNLFGNIPNQLCEALEEVKINGVALVGDPDVIADACGGGSAEVFVSNISQFLEDNLKPLGITNLVLAVIMMLDLCASCVLLWSKKDQYLTKKEQQEQQQQQAQEQAAYNNKAGPELAQGA